MRMDTGQYQRMEQTMKLSPRMIQSMEILQLPMLALEERIAQELESNPVLEIQEIKPNPVEDGNPTEAEPDIDAQTLDVADTERETAKDDFNRLAEMSERYGESWEANTYGSSSYRGSSRLDGERDAKSDAMANTAARASSLGEQLEDQWRMIDVEDPITNMAGRHLLNYIEPDGYIRTAIEDIAMDAPGEVTQDDLEEARQILMYRGEPAGMGSRTLQECLHVQLDIQRQESNDPDEIMEISMALELVADHLKDIEMNRLPKIAKRIGVDIDDVKRGLVRMGRLDPRPGGQLSPDPPQIVVPDVLVEYDSVHDCYVAGLSGGRTPGLRISPSYQALAKDRELDKESRDFLNQNVNTAKWLIDSIDQRNSTLMRVVNVVLSAQREFFDGGPEHLKPLPMIQVADQLGIHVGTVSRAVSEKYLQTPRGIFPLRMFFSGGTESADGEEMSWAAVQAKLKSIIDSEDPAEPLSDDALVVELKEHGIEIARRTVAKYRQMLKIPPARQRRKF